VAQLFDYLPPPSEKGVPLPKTTVGKDGEVSNPSILEDAVFWVTQPLFAQGPLFFVAPPLPP